MAKMEWNGPNDLNAPNGQSGLIDHLQGGPNGTANDPSGPTPIPLSYSLKPNAIFNPIVLVIINFYVCNIHEGQIQPTLSIPTYEHEFKKPAITKS